MKILAVTPRYPSSSMVGAWIATHSLLRHLVDCGHQATAYQSLALDETYEIDGVTVHSARKADGHLTAAELADDADVVLSHCGDGGFGLEVAQVAGKPSVRLFHGGDHVGPGDLIVFNSYSSARPVDSRSVIVRPFTDPDRYRTPRDAADAITLVNLSAAKGGDLFGRMARTLTDRPFLGVRGGYGVQLIPPHRNVTVLPTTDDMRAVYARTRLLLMPSERETWGMAGVEAMCSGIPVIAHPTPGLLESLGTAGIFVDRRDASGWVQAIRSLDDPAVYAAASRRAAARAQALAAKARADRDRFLTVLEELVASRSTTGRTLDLPCPDRSHPSPRQRRSSGSPTPSGSTPATSPPSSAPAAPTATSPAPRSSLATASA